MLYCIIWIREKYNGLILFLKNVLAFIINFNDIFIQDYQHFPASHYNPGS